MKNIENMKHARKDNRFEENNHLLKMGEERVVMSYNVCKVTLVISKL